MIRILKERLVYENEFAKVFDDDVEFPDGSTGRYIASVWKAPYGVAILPVHGDQVLLMSVFRHRATASTLEIPKGFGSENLSVEESVHTELKEETGYTAKKITPIFDLGVKYKTHVYVAYVSSDAVPTDQNSESSEDIRGYEWVNIRDISIELFRACHIHDEITIASLQALREFFHTK